MFFWRHKVLTVLIILVAVYWHQNKAGQFGFVRPGIVVYNRLPVMFFDFFVDTAGATTPIGDLTERNVFRSWMNGRGNMPLPLGGSDYTLVVGTGFGPKPSFLLPDSLTADLRSRSIVVEQAPTPRAAEIYNVCKRQKKMVAALMRVK